MLFLARRTALPTPGETCVCWAKIEDTQTNVANRNRERCFIAEISALIVCLGREVTGLPVNIGPDSRRCTFSGSHSILHGAALRGLARLRSCRKNRSPQLFAGGFRVVQSRESVLTGERKLSFARQGGLTN